METKTVRAAIAAVICVAAALSSLAYTHAHRWSFNGDYSDSVGTLTATPTGSPTFSNGMLVLPGGNKGTGNVDLGENALSVGSDSITIEIWARQNQGLKYARIFDYYPGDGSNKNNDIYMAWSTGANFTSDKVEVKSGGSVKFNAANQLQPYSQGTMYHISMVISTNANGSTTVSYAKRNTTSGVVEKSYSNTINSWTLTDFHTAAGSPHLHLGCSMWGESDPKADYDEVRISSGVIGAEQLTANAILGPDVAVSNGTDNATGFTIPANATFNFPDGAYSGNAFTVTGAVTLESGAKIVFDTANMSSASMTFSAASYSLPSGVSSILDMVELTDSTGYEATLSGTTITVASKNLATWTGAAGNGDWQTPGNWVDGKVPDAGTAVTISGSAVNLSLPVGTTFACASLEIGACTFTADCDWRGLAVTPTIGSAANLNGHVLTLNNLEANGGASFSNTSATDGEVRFYADGDPANVTETTFVTGLANLTTASKVKIVIIRTNASTASGSLDIGAANKRTVFRAEGGTISMTANGAVGMTANGEGCLEVAGGTVDFCTANNRGLKLGGSSGRASMKISAGKLQTNWIDAGHDGVTDCTITQTGGEVKTGINNNGNIWLGRNGNGKATYVMSGGTVNATQGTLDVGNYGTGTFTQSGGDVVTGSGDVRVGMYSGSTGTYTLNAGNMTPSYWLHVGYYGTGTFIQNGGNAVLTDAGITQGNWLCLGENAAGNGKYVMNGGYLEVGTGAKGGGIFPGRRGIGRFELNGGTVFTPAFIDQAGHSTVLLNGGTIKVSKDSGTGMSSQHSGEYGIFKDIDDLVFGSRATTLDTNGHDTKIMNCGYEPLPNSALVKSGTGKLTVAAVPPVDTLTVSNGTLAVSADSDNTQTAWLAHRWSFNDNYSDSVGGSTGTVIGHSDQLSFEVSPLGGKMVKMASTNTSNNSTDGASLDLGALVWGVGDVTIEIWGRQDAVRNYGRIIDYGYGTANYFYMAWSNGTDGSKDKLGVRSTSAFDTVGGMSPYELGTLYHISVSFKRNDDGSTSITWQRRNVETGAVEKSGGRTLTAWTLDKLGAAHFYIGHSQWSSDKDANASYDEVRVWRGVLNEAALTLSAQKGPDATAADLAAVVAKNGESAPAERTLELNSAATLEIASGTTFTQPVVKGNGTVSGGTLKVADSLVVKCGETLLASGTVDLSDAKVVLSDPANLASTGSFKFLKAPAGQTLTIVGTPTAVGLPRGWRLRMKGDTAGISKSGFVILVK